MNTEFEEFVYEIPQVRVIEVEVEKGFAISYGGADGNEENM